MRLVYVANDRRQCGRCHKPLMRCVGAVGSTPHPIICWMCVTSGFTGTVNWQVAYFSAAEEAVAPLAPAGSAPNDIPW